MNKKKILLVCREFNQTTHLIKIINSNKNFFLIASDNGRIHRLAQKYSSVKKTIWLDQMNSIYTVSKESIKIFDEVNNWFKNLPNVHSSIKDLLYWPKQFEGGHSQKIIDFLLIKKSYEEILNEELPDEVIILKNMKLDWKDNIFFDILYLKKIPVKIINVDFSLLSFTKIFLWLPLRPYFAATYMVLNVIQAKFRYIINGNFFISDDHANIAIQLVGVSKNHHNYTKLITRSLEEEGFRTIILGWHLRHQANALRRGGFNLSELERWIKVYDIFWILYQVIVSRIRAAKKIKKLCKNNGPLKKILDQSILDFYLSTLLDSALLKKACINYFKSNQPLAIRTHSIDLREAAIIYKASQERALRPLIFFQSSWPYNNYEPLTDVLIPRKDIVVFVAGELNKKILISQGFVNNNIHINGLRWLQALMKYSFNTSKKTARKSLGLSNSESVILFDANSTLRGYMTKQEQQTILFALLEFVKLHPDCFLLIKPHPVSQDVLLINEIIGDYNLRNVKLISKNNLPYDAIRASDYLISKSSTLILEAAYLDVPALGIVLDNELEWEFYGKSVDYCHTLPELISRLEFLLNDSIFRKNWIIKMKRKQLDFFKKHSFLESDTQMHDLATFLKKRILESRG